MIRCEKWALRFVIAVGLMIGLALPAYAAVEATKGSYYEKSIDMRVKVLGGSIEIERSFYDGRWAIARAWKPIQITYNNGGSTVHYIKRDGVVYNYAAGSNGLFINKKTRSIQILGTQGAYTGFRWQNRQGDWIEYNIDGRVVAYGSRNNIKVTLKYGVTGNLIGVLDHHGKQILWFSYTNGNLTSIKDYTNREVLYSYTNNLLSGVTGLAGSTWAYTYKSSTELSSVTDPLGRKLNIFYNANNKVASVKDVAGNGESYVYNYDSANKEYYVKVTTAAGKVTESWYSPDMVQIRQVINGVKTLDVAAGTTANSRIETDAFGNKTTKKYDEWDNLVSETFADGSTRSRTYDAKLTLLLSETNENGVTHKYSYDPYGNMLTKTEAVGKPVERLTNYTYDSFGQMLTAKRALSTYSYTYDTYGNRLTTTDPLNNTTTYSYDAMGNTLTEKNPLNQVTTYTYDAAGRMLTRKDSLNHVASYSYDGAGNELTMTDPNGNVTTNTYDNRGRLVSTTDAAGGITRMEYDADGNLIKKIDAEGKARSFSYDLSGRMKSITDGNGNTISMGSDCNCSRRPSTINFPTFTRTMTYDKRGRVSVITDILDPYTSQSTTVAYDGIGNEVSTTDLAGRVTKNTYDALSRLATVTDPTGGVTAYTYDVFDNLLSVKGAKGNLAFRYEFDKANRKVKELRPMGQFNVFVHDGIGRLTEKTDALGNKTTYSYDVTGRVTGISYPAANGMPAKTVSFTYDANGNLTGYDDGTTTGTYSYDANNRKVTDTVNYGSFSLSSSYAYYKNGLKKSFIGPDGKRIDYAYDAGNLLSTVAIPGEGSVVYNRYNWSAPTKVTLPGGSTKNYSYDGLLRPTNIHMKDPAANTLMNYSYSYDAAGNISAKNTEYGAYNYGYDNLDRLTSADYPASQAALADETFGYDKVGNRITHNGDVANPWSYNANNELTARLSVSYQYDANGTQVKKTEGTTVTDYIYNGENRLAQVKQGANIIAEYGYDPFGRRLFKIVGGTKVYFYYADEGLVAEADSTGAVNVTYGYQPSSVWGTEPIYMSVNAIYHYYLNDHLGTPQKMVEKNGAKSWEAIYEVFGKATVINSVVVNNLRLPGQYLDVETGYQYNFQRIYDGQLGRYIMKDIFGLFAGENNYIYGLGNPLMSMDPFGLLCERMRTGSWFEPTSQLRWTPEKEITWYSVYKLPLDLLCGDKCKKIKKIIKIIPKPDAQLGLLWYNQERRFKKMCSYVLACDGDDCSKPRPWFPSAECGEKWEKTGETDWEYAGLRFCFGPWCTR